MTYECVNWWKEDRAIALIPVVFVAKDKVIFGWLAWGVMVDWS